VVDETRFAKINNCYTLSMLYYIFNIVILLPLFGCNDSEECLPNNSNAILELLDVVYNHM
jgi:hypothetical protein